MNSNRSNSSNSDESDLDKQVGNYIIGRIYSKI